MRVHIINLLKDNYSYLLVNPFSQRGWLVDPAVSETVMHFLQNEQFKAIGISTILLTHKHWDHCGEVDQLVKHLSHRNSLLNIQEHIEVLTGKEDTQNSTTMALERDTQLEREGIMVQVLKTPCHTRGHTLYRLHYSQQAHNHPVSPDHSYSNVLFTGDTLFSSGCGRFFEGTASEMLSNMQKIGELPGDTQVFCGHEYTVANLQWSLKVLPNHPSLKEKFSWACHQRQHGLPTMPTSIASELKTNLFMQCHNQELQELLGVGDGVSCMETLRQMKNDNIGLSNPL